MLRTQSTITLLLVLSPFTFACSGDGGATSSEDTGTGGGAMSPAPDNQVPVANDQGNGGTTGDDPLPMGGTGNVPTLDGSPCGDTAHGEMGERVRYQFPLATTSLDCSGEGSDTGDSGGCAGECVPETQYAECMDGEWGEWSGTFTEETCVAGTGAPCPGVEIEVPHGTRNTRTGWFAPSVPAGETCQSETQYQLCNDGVWEGWTGTYRWTGCLVEVEGCDNGAMQNRIAHKDATVPFGNVCPGGENQQRSCQNNEWGSWSGSFTNLSCEVEAPVDCSGGAHGDTEQQIRYQSASVPSGSSCQSEQQERDCYNGTWSGWSGSYAAESCQVEASPWGYCTTVSDGEAFACNEYTGASWTQVQVDGTCLSPNTSSNIPCTSANRWGICDTSSGVGYEYSASYYRSILLPDLTTARETCEALLGTWNPE